MNIDKLKLANELLQESWDFMYQQDDVTFESKMIDDSGFICIKCTANINTTAKNAHDFIWNTIGNQEALFKADNTLTTFNILEEGDNYRKIYQANQLPWPLAPRDLVMEEYNITNGILMYSTYYETVNDKCVRSDLTISYHGFIPSGETCQVVRIVHVNPNGYIPTAIVNMFVGKAAVFIELLKKKFN